MLLSLPYIVLAKIRNFLRCLTFLKKEIMTNQQWINLKIQVESLNITLDLISREIEENKSENIRWNLGVISSIANELFEDSRNLTNELYNK